MPDISLTKLPWYAQVGAFVALSGASELPVTGRIRVGTAEGIPADPAAARAAGIVLLPEERKAQAIFPDLGVAENVTLPALSRVSRFGWWIQRRRAREAAATAMRETGVRAAASSVSIATLSGGNQQKIVLAREIGRDPRVLIAFQPTWGLDPGATRFVIDTILALRDRGGAVLYISSELEEVLSVGDRIGVISEGRIVGITDRADVDIVELGLLMAGSAKGGDVPAAA